MIFKDRVDAAEKLADQLMAFRSKKPLVLAVPRGALPLGAILADRLGGDLDVVLVHKIGAPENPEYAIGSVSEFGNVYRTSPFAIEGDSEKYFEQEAKSEIQRLQERRKKYSPIRHPIPPRDRTVVIVDDGIATGATLLAAVRAIRAQSPRELIVAAPVASSNAVALLRPEVDQLVLLDVPQAFYAISQFYERFPQVSDEEAVEILTQKTKGSAA